MTLRRLNIRILAYSLPVATLPLIHFSYQQKLKRSPLSNDIKFNHKRYIPPPTPKSAIREYLIEPLLTFKRFLWLCILFLPLVATSPIIYLNSNLWYRLLTSQMSRAGPTFIKLGQWAASRTDLFPPQLCSILGRLHSSAKPHSLAHTNKVLTATYSDAHSLDDIFENFDTTPIGCGAIAQVYKGTLKSNFIPDDWLIHNRTNTNSSFISFFNNALNYYYLSSSVDDNNDNIVTFSRDVAVKVIHPHIPELIERDLSILYAGASLLSLLPGFKWLSLPEEVKVFGNLMRSQLNLSVEATNLARFEDNFRERRGAASFPKPVFNLCSNDILVEEFEDALPLKTFLKFGGGGFEQRIAGLGLDAFLTMLLIDNFAHADLHPGNIYIKFYKPSTMDIFKNMLSSMLSQPRPTTDLATNELSKSVMNDLLPLSKHINENPKDEKYINEWDYKLRKLNEEGFQPEIVFLDTGLITELNDVNRRNFLQLFRAVSQFDGYRVGQLMVERCRSPQLAKDPETFALKMQHIVLGVKSKTFSLAKISLSDTLSKVLSSVRDHHVKMEADFVNTVLSILLLEGIGRQLDPDMDLFKAAIPILRQLGKKVGTSSYSEVDKGNLGAMLKLWVWIEAREFVSSVHEMDDCIRYDWLSPNI